MTHATQDFLRRYGPWALVTGGAAGLGAGFALQLAERGLDVVLVDVDSAGLERMQTAIGSLGRQALTIAVDLSTPNFMEAVRPAIDGLDIGLLVNNAGISAIGFFDGKPLEEHLRVIDVNVRAPLALTHALIPKLKKRGRGGLVFVSSQSSLQGTAMVANYAGTKAWNLIFAEGLWDELREHGVDVLGYLVGSTRTRSEHSGPDLERARHVPIMSVEDTVRHALAALGKTPSISAGPLNRLLSFVMTRLLPRKMLIRTVSGATRKMYDRGG
ncbi:MAG: SDR family NAD(P)-dependent oxidoreductase [Nannocystaceae bacterium]